MAVLDAAVEAFRLHDPDRLVCYDHARYCCPCGVHDLALDDMDRHIVAQILAAGFRTANPDDVRDLNPDRGESDG